MSAGDLGRPRGAESLRNASHTPARMLIHEDGAIKQILPTERNVVTVGKSDPHGQRVIKS